MPNRDATDENATGHDERFAAYLRQFRPLAPDALPNIRRASRRPLVLAFCAAAVLVAIGVVLLRLPAPQPALNQGDQGVIRRGPVLASSPLTIRNANVLLAVSPSFKEAIDGIAFPPTVRLPEGTQSAVDVLSKEKIKL